MYSVWGKYVWMVVKMHNFLTMFAADNRPVQHAYSYNTLIESSKVSEENM